MRDFCEGVENCLKYLERGWNRKEGRGRGLVDQLQIFSRLYLIKLQGFLANLGLLELWHLTYPWVLTGFGMLVFFTNLSLRDFRSDNWPYFFFSQ